MAKFLKGFGIALLFCLVVWAFLWVFKYVVDFVLTALGLTAGILWALGLPAIIIIIGCIIYGIWYKNNK